MTRTTPTRPNCTHITMDVIHLSPICDICGQESSLGWVYECQQDRYQKDLKNLDSSNSGNSRIDFANGSKPNMKSHYSTEVLELASLGFSDSIIQQAQKCLYTSEQIGILIKQKVQVRNIIQTAENETLHPNITVRKKKQPLFKKSDIKTHMNVQAKCSLRCCHACRSYYKDRCFASLNAVVLNDNTNFDFTSTADLKIANAVLMRQIGLKAPKESLTQPVNSQDSSVASDSRTFSSVYDDWTEDEASINELPTINEVEHGRPAIYMPVRLENFSRNNESDQPDNHCELDNDDEKVEEEPRRSSGISTLGNLIDKLRGITRRASFKRLKRSSSAPIFSTQSKKIKTFSVKNSDAWRSTEFNVDINLDDGIALSEIAVEEHVPDIITQA